MGQGDSFKEKRALKKSEEEMKKMIIQSIINTNSCIEAAQKNYEFAEGDLIDYYLYTIKANQSKLDYLIKKSKIYGIELSRIEKLEFINFDENQVV